MPQFEISELARKYAAWSYSKAELASTCPAQFKHKHLLKTQGVSSGTDANVGTVAHEILEHSVKGTPKGVARKAALEKTPLTSDELDQLRVLDENAETFLQRFDRFCKAQGVTKILTEVEWAITDDYRPTTFFAKDVYFRGKVDLGALTSDGTLFVLDHKSGFAKPLAKDAPKRQQLQTYGVLAAACMPEIEGVRAGIHFLQGDDPELRLQWMDFVPTYNLRKAYAPWLFEFINQCASNLREPFEARVSKKAKGWPCNWCNYQSLCPTFKEKHGGA